MNRFLHPSAFAWLVLLLCPFTLFVVVACSSQKELVTPSPIYPEISIITDMPADSPVVQPTIPATNTQTPTSTTTQTPTMTATRTETSSPPPKPTRTPTPTYSILRGEVLVRSNCRYGPGAPYLYKYGLVPGSNLDIIGRNDAGSWVLIQAIGGSNLCWVKASLMDIKGDVMSVAPTYLPLPQSPYYPPIRAVSAQRDGDKVTIFWGAVQLRPGDETASPQYIVEAWVCQDGGLVFIPIGVDQNVVEVIDEAGCIEPSHGQVMLAEKHGYTRPVEIPWPVNVDL